MKQKLKVIKLESTIKHYNVPVYNILNQKYDFTVLYYEKSSDSAIDECEFKTIYVPAKKVYKFMHIKEDIAKICKDYDVVIAVDSINIWNYFTLAFKPHKYKLIYWGIGAPASYTRHYGEAGKLYYAINDAMEKRADALVFYAQEAIDLHLNRGFKGPKMFVAPNTTSVLKREVKPELKDSIMFIGSLYLEKGLQILLDAYKAAYEEDKTVVKLNLVGGGEPLPQIKQWVKDNNLEESVKVLGPIYDNETKADLFQKTLACISPLQGGLSVLESMGYGVPYITDANAITGGEAFNIEDRRTGLRVEGMNAQKLKDIILDISSHKQKYIAMGQNAYEHYWSNRKPEDMAQGVFDAIEYVLSK